MNVSGSSSWYESRPDRMRVGSGGLMDLAQPKTEKAPNDIVGYDNVKLIEQEQKALYGKARAALEGKMSFTAGLGTLRIAANDDKGVGRQATLTYTDQNGESQKLEFSITDDTRISWDENGAPVIQQGAQALEKGVLTAKGANDFLIRVNADVVQGGDAQSTVLNLSEKAGSFIGGKGGMTFWGSYKDSTITGGEGENRFAGVFTGSTVSGGASKDTFSGFFAQSQVKGGAADDTFSGIFFDNSEIYGEDGDDSFSGRFVSAKLYGGSGKNFFGYQSNLESDYAVKQMNKETVEGDAGRTPKNPHPTATENRFFMEAAAAINNVAPKVAAVNQFTNVVIDGSEGDAELAGSFQKADITLGEGRNSVKGFIKDTRVDASRAERNDIHLGFAESSTVLSGSADDRIRMTTGRNTRIDSGDGDDAIIIGNHNDQPSNTMTMGGAEWDLAFTEFDTDVRDDNPLVSHGTLEYNVVNAARGKNTVAVNTGDESARFLSGDKVDTEDEETVEETQAAEAPAASSKDKKTQTLERLEASLPFEKEVVATAAGEAVGADAEEENALGDLTWKFETADFDRAKRDGTFTGGVQIIMNDDERRTFNQSYGARKAKQRTYTNFASSNLGEWVV